MTKRKSREEIWAGKGFELGSLDEKRDFVERTKIACPCISREFQVTHKIKIIFLINDKNLRIKIYMNQSRFQKYILYTIFYNLEKKIEL